MLEHHDIVEDNKKISKFIESTENFFTNQNKSTALSIQHGTFCVLVKFYLMNTAAYSTALCERELLRMFDIKELLASRAEEFFFNNSLYFLRNNNNSFSSHSGALSEGVTDMLCEINMLEVMESRLYEGLFSQYVEALVRLVPDISIDDLIVANLDFYPLSVLGCPVAEDFRTPRSYTSALYWMYHLLSHKLFSRSILKYIFHQVIYFDSNDRFLVFKIVEKIIHQYANLDSILELEEAPSAATSISKLDDKMVTGKLDSKGLLGNMSDCDVHELQRFIDTKNIAEDNVYVLASLAWNELIVILLDETHRDSPVNSSAVSLLIAIIEKTGPFIQRRIETHKSLFKNINVMCYNLLEVMKTSFKTLDGMKPELTEWMALNKLTD